MRLRAVAGFRGPHTHTRCHTAAAGSKALMRCPQTPAYRPSDAAPAPHQAGCGLVLARAGLPPLPGELPDADAAAAVRRGQHPPLRRAERQPGDRRSGRAGQQQARLGCLSREGRIGGAGRRPRGSVRRHPEPLGRRAAHNLHRCGGQRDGAIHHRHPAPLPAAGHHERPGVAERHRCGSVGAHRRQHRFGDRRPLQRGARGHRPVRRGGRHQAAHQRRRGHGQGRAFVGEQLHGPRPAGSRHAHRGKHGLRRRPAPDDVAGQHAGRAVV
mmetsp:Transcript_14279/g.54096  ORF Transcript_14279/g.54096 Transcript_14279/m.54096 type:complete len:270 (+) Transcript_14279:1-810(+)